jgi:Ohr subfamily peroxiredoxin
VDLCPPRELRGEGGGTNPEQLFAIGYAACFESALDTAARRRGRGVADVAIESSVRLMPTKSRGYALAVTLAVTMPWIWRDDAVELVRAAYQVARTRTRRAATSTSRSPRTGMPSSPPRQWPPERGVHVAGTQPSEPGTGTADGVTH